MKTIKVAIIVIVGCIILLMVPLAYNLYMTFLPDTEGYRMVGGLLWTYAAMGVLIAFLYIAVKTANDNDTGN